MPDIKSCANLGCHNPVTHLIINSQTNLAVSALCGVHTEEMKKEGTPTGIALYEIPTPDFPPKQTKPQKQGELPMSAVPPPVTSTNPATSAVASTATAPPSAMAPQDAVYDEDPVPFEVPPDDEVPGRSTIQRLDPEEASTNFFWIYGTGPHTYKLQTTVRGLPDLHLLDEHIRTTIATMNIVNQAGGKATEVATSAAPAQTATIPGVPGQSAPQATQPTEGTFIAARMTVTIRPDGKAQVGFFGANDQFARCSMVNVPEAIANALAKCGAWTPQYFATAQNYQGLNYKITWKNSDRMNSKGNPYKNIVSIDPA